MAEKYLAKDIDKQVIQHLEEKLTGVMPDKRKEAIALVARHLTNQHGIELKDAKGGYYTLNDMGLETLYVKLTKGGSITPMFNRVKELAREAAEIKRPLCIEHYFNHYCHKHGIKYSYRAVAIYKSIADKFCDLSYDNPSWKNDQALKDELAAIQKDLTLLYGLYIVILNHQIK